MNEIKLEAHQMGHQMPPSGAVWNGMDTHEEEVRAAFVKGSYAEMKMDYSILLFPTPDPV